MSDMSDMPNQYHYGIPCTEFSVQLGDSTIKCAKGNWHAYTGEDQVAHLTGVSPSIMVKYTRQAYNVLSSKGIKPFGLGL